MLGQPLLPIHNLGGLDVAAFGGVSVFVGDGRRDAACGLLLVGFPNRRFVVGLNPKAGEFAVRRRKQIVVGGVVELLDFKGINAGVEIRLHSEDIARQIVGGGTGGEDDVLLVFTAAPIDRVFLPIHANVKPLNCRLGQLGFVVSQERSGLLVKEVDAVVENGSGDASHFDDAALGHLIDQQFHDQTALVGQLMPSGRIATGVLHGEHLLALAAAVTLRTRLRQS